FATTVAENVRIGNKDASDAEVATALVQAGLPLDPGRVVGELGATLSGGEARRLALSRLFAGSYDVLVLDEPTEHLDAPTADALLDDLWSHRERRALLVVTHDERVVARCDKVVRLGAALPR
ncbi:MAG TPA: ATP-binding cassette domain-containing protein, partial [Propionibacteriaceae bacterium]|nr:ATP-binding cassette domain-containing protein [Propionibacteriaceae bacterium]